MRLIAGFLMSLVLLAPAWGLEPLAEDRGVNGLGFLVRKLQSGLRVMYVVAHPDDEDGGTITYLSRGLGADVTLVSVTRGEGGANQVSNDFFDRLGALRSLELQAAAQYYGADVRFTTFTDYGFSKTMDEALRNWDERELVGELVRLIREEKPHIVMCRWRGNPRDGHGQHQAAGRVAWLAYQAAGDAAQYPELAEKGLEPWAPQQYFAGNYSEDEDAEGLVGIDSGIYDPLLGMTFAQFARLGLQNQRSQGAGSAQLGPGPQVRWYQRRDAPEGVALASPAMFSAATAGAALPADWTEQFIPALEAKKGTPQIACVAAEAARSLVRRGETIELTDRLGHEATLDKIIAQGLQLQWGMTVEPANRPSGPFSAFMPFSTPAVATAGSEIPVAYVRSRGTASSPWEQWSEELEPGCLLLGGGMKVAGEGGWASLSPGDSGGAATLQIAPAAKPTVAPWSRSSDFAPRYELASDAAFGLPQPKAPVNATLWVSANRHELELTSPVMASYLDGTGIQRRRPLAIGPAFSVKLPTAGGFLPVGQGTYEITAEVTSHRTGASEAVVLPRLPAGWSATPGQQKLTFAGEGAVAQAAFTLATPGGLGAGEYPVEMVVQWERGGESSSSFEHITYPGLDSLYLSRPARHSIRVVDADLPDGLQIGYVMGTGDDVPAAIRQLGAEVTLLDESALAGGELGRFHTIVLGIRAYANREDLIRNNARLLKYVEDGGVLVVQYNTPEFDKNFGPYPYVMGRRPEEVAEQDSVVRILQPGHSLFVWPNRITEADFDGWVEQRGSKFLSEWDERYVPLIETHDEGQDPQEGIWLAARYGKGMYVYCALAWYRQLPYAAPGAARIFANLISQGHPGAPWRSE